MIFFSVKRRVCRRGILVDDGVHFWPVDFLMESHEFESYGKMIYGERRQKENQLYSFLSRRYTLKRLAKIWV